MLRDTLENVYEICYYYDADGNMMESVVRVQVDNLMSYQWTTYIGNYFERQVDYTVDMDTGQLVSREFTYRKYFYAGSTRIAMRLYEGETSTLYWLLGDHLGSQSITANADGSFHSEVRYSAFGETRYTSQTGTPTDYLYTGQRIEEEAGLYYYGARFYDPVLNHFIQADTVVPEAGKSQTYDRYAYANNNPIIHTDPTGHFALLIAAAVGAVVGFSVDILIQTIPQYLNGTSPLEVNINWAEAAGATAAGAISGLTLGAGTAIFAGSSATTSVAVMALSGGLGNVAGNQAGAVVQSSIEMESSLLSEKTIGNAVSMHEFGNSRAMIMDFAWGAMAGGISEGIKVSSIYSNTPKTIQNEWRLTNNGTVNRFTTQPLVNRLGNEVIKPNFAKQIPTKITFYTGITTFSNYAESIFTTMIDKKIGKGNNDY